MTRPQSPAAPAPPAFLTKVELHALADRLLAPEPWEIERCVGFVVSETRGLWHGRARAMMCRRLKHCGLEHAHSTALLACILGRLEDGTFSEQFKDQLRLALHLDAERAYAVARSVVASRTSRAHARRYAEWVLSHRKTIEVS